MKAITRTMQENKNKDKKNKEMETNDIHKKQSIDK
jgi:hypothetical protein